MKERKIKIIVGLMSISVIGLIALQIYWMNNLIKIEEERFERSVNIALINTADKLEKLEATNAVLNKITGGKDDVTVFIQTDSLSNVKKIEKKIPFKLKKTDSTNHAAIGYRVTYSSDSSNGKKRLEVLENRTVPEHGTSVNYMWKFKPDTLVFRQKQLVQNVVTELVSQNSGKKIEDRLSTSKLDSLLSSEFKNNGINTDYYFAVDKLNSDSLTLVKTGADTSMLRKSNLKTMLFPGEMFFNPNQLIVYFPNKKTYIFSSILGMLGLSIALILIIAGVFFKTVQMFIRQKKITEIKNDLINNITHEFKTPISTISVACEALNEPGLTIKPESVNKYSSIIKEENERLRMMVENLLNTAAFEKDTYHLAKENLDLDEIINKSVEKFEEMLKQKSGNIEVEGMPSSLKVNADKFHLMNIISNLIDNSIKYNERTPDIKITVERKDKFASIKVSDNGIGIAKDNLNKIFETFYRVPTGNVHNVRGNGIGLSYAKKIIEAHGGTISAVSSLGKGSTFEIKIPLSE